MTLTEAQTLRKIYFDALVQIGARQSYTINSGGVNRTVTYADVKWVQSQFTYYDNMVARLASCRNGLAHRQGVPTW